MTMTMTIYDYKITLFEHKQNHRIHNNNSPVQSNLF